LFTVQLRNAVAAAGDRNGAKHDNLHTLPPSTPHFLSKDCCASQIVVSRACGVSTEGAAPEVPPPELPLLPPLLPLLLEELVALSSPHAQTNTIEPTTLARTANTGAEDDFIMRDQIVRLSVPRQVIPAFVSRGGSSIAPSRAPTLAHPASSLARLLDCSNCF
jgi:hypothetical protein